MGRRSTAASAANRSIVWLWASEANLKSPIVSGYRLSFGDDTADDELILQRVDAGTVNNILISQNAVPSGLTDIGLLIRVTRTESSEWTLYTSVLPVTDAEGAVATSVPSAGNTPILQGSVTDPVYSGFSNGYFGFMAVHDANLGSRSAAEFDQLYFGTSSDASLPVGLTSFTATAGSGEIQLNWSTESETDNVGFIILRSYNNYGIYSEIDSYRMNLGLLGLGNSSLGHDYTYTDYDVELNVNYWYKLHSVDADGTIHEYGPISAIILEGNEKPSSFYLNQNYPNPFNSTTHIRYGLPEMSDTEIVIFNMLGQRVAQLVSQEQPAGRYLIEWDASAFPSGLYYLSIMAGEFHEVKRMILIR
jgi:hypothetical protein